MFDFPCPEGEVLFSPNCKSSAPHPAVMIHTADAFQGTDYDEVWSDDDNDVWGHKPAKDD